MANLLQPMLNFIDERKEKWGCDYLARPAAGDLEALRRDFEPVWGLPRRGALDAADAAAAAAHARAHRGAAHWFYAPARATAPAAVDAALAARGLVTSARLLRGVSVGLTPTTRCLATRFELYGACVVDDWVEATHVVSDVAVDAPAGVAVVGRSWLRDCLAARAVAAPRPPDLDYDSEGFE